MNTSTYHSEYHNHSWPKSTKIDVKKYHPYRLWSHQYSCTPSNAETQRLKQDLGCMVNKVSESTSTSTYYITINQSHTKIGQNRPKTTSEKKTNIAPLASIDGWCCRPSWQAFRTVGGIGTWGARWKGWVRWGSPGPLTGNAASSRGPAEGKHETESWERKWKKKKSKRKWKRTREPGWNENENGNKNETEKRDQQALITDK